MRPYKLTKCIIPESRRVIEYLLSILTLHRNTMSAVEKSVRNIAEDVQSLQTDVSGIGEHNRRNLDQLHGSLGSIHNGNNDILRSQEDSRARQQWQAQGNDLSAATI